MKKRRIYALDEILFLPDELGECWLDRLAERCGGGWGGEPPADRGDPGGRVSVTDIKAAIGDGPAPAPVTGGEPAVLPKGDPAEPFVRGALLAYPKEKILLIIYFL